MVVKVEGVEPAHTPKPAKGPAQVAVWQPAVRLAVLKLAMSGNWANLNSDQILNRARDFEKYVMQGADPAPESLPSVQEQITNAFINLAGSLDGVTNL